MRTMRGGGVLITSPTTIPKNQDVAIAWKTDNARILGFEVRIGTVAGRWDIFTSRIGKDLREIRLPCLPQDLTTLYVEFGYIVPSIATMHGHASTENVLLTENPLKITRVKPASFVTFRREIAQSPRETGARGLRGLASPSAAVPIPATSQTRTGAKKKGASSQQYT